MGAAVSSNPALATRTASDFRMVSIPSYFLAFLLLNLLLGACAAEIVRHAVVSFVAGVLIDGPVQLGHGDLTRPRLGPSGGIVHGELIQHCVRVHARELLDDFQLGAGGRLLERGAV